MPIFRYEAFTASGQTQVNTIEASTETEAGDKVRAMGLFIQRIERNSSEPMRTILPGADEAAEVLAEKTRVSEQALTHPTKTVDPERKTFIIEEPVRMVAGDGIPFWERQLTADLEAIRAFASRCRVIVGSDNLADGVASELRSEAYRQAYNRMCEAGVIPQEKEPRNKKRGSFAGPKPKSKKRSTNLKRRR